VSESDIRGISLTCKPLLWTSHQLATLESIEHWCRDRTAPQIYQVRGAAGTGKSTLAVELANSCSAIALCYQAKATSVLRRKGAERVSTIHSFLYRPPDIKRRADGSDELLWRLKEWRERAHLLVIDEASQIDAGLGRHLAQLGIRILTFGDDHQLPPIGEQKPFFVQFPIDVALSQIHRQALNSPVLKVAHALRESGVMPKGRDYDLDDLVAADVVLTAFREIRRVTNIRIRRKLLSIRNADAPPIIGERVICLRTNMRTRFTTVRSRKSSE
jgi:exodeoxyribonuclease V